MEEWNTTLLNSKYQIWEKTSNVVLALVSLFLDACLLYVEEFRHAV